MRKKPLKNKAKTIKPRKKGPGYRLHKPTGQGFVELDGKRFYCGRYDLPESEAKAHRLIAAWLANGKRLDADDAKQVNAAKVEVDDRLTVEEVAARFWIDAQRRYVRPDGTPSMELAHFRTALDILRSLYGPSPAIDFGPNALRLCRETMIERKWSRAHVNTMTNRIRRVFRFAVGRELLPASVPAALEAVDGLRRGEAGVKDGRKVKPVPLAHVEAIKPYVSSPVRALIELQLLTGARPGELVAMKPRDLNTTGRVWEYRPESHKTAHHGHERTIYLGPRAQVIVKPFMARALDAFMFSPIEAEVEKQAKRRAARKTPLYPSHAARYERQKATVPKWKPRDHYTTDTYRQSIEHGIKAANRAIEKAIAADGVKRDLIPRWHPHQLRHSAATELRREFGLESARIILGHRSAAVTEVYAEVDAGKAKDIIGKVG